MNELKSCMFAQLDQNCANAEDSEKLQDFVRPLLDVHCDGDSLKSDALTCELYHSNSLVVPTLCKQYTAVICLLV